MINGCIFEYDNKKFIVISDVLMNNRSLKLVWCSFGNDLDELLSSKDYSVMRISTKWKYIDRVSDADLKILNDNFNIVFNSNENKHIFKFTRNI